MISYETSGDFNNLEGFLKKMSKGDIFSTLDKYGRMGVAALASATPSSSGLAASSWGYKVERARDQYSIIWTNSDIENGFPVVVMLQHGYATGTGGYVQGRDFINPAIKPVMDQISDEVWKAVTTA
jgi:hypothetical protein